jgi:hypothetical protein
MDEGKQTFDSIGGWEIHSIGLTNTWRGEENVLNFEI